MECLTLPHGRTTSRLAFGCAGLGGSLDYADSRKLLSVAWESGFRHFDVAPSYGVGEAELNLGRFLKEVGAKEATITTKAGIAAGASNSAILRAIRTLARPVLNRVPSIRKKIGSRLRENAARGLFSPDQIVDSLDRSLRSLGVERIDVFMLHEARAEDMSEEVVRVLEDSIAAGKVGCLGVGSRREAIAGIVQIADNPFKVFQTSWHLDLPFPPAPRGAISSCHGVMKQIGRFDEILEDTNLRDRLSAATGLDFERESSKVDLLLAMAMEDMNGGIVVAQSRSADRIRATAVSGSRSGLSAIGLAGNAILGRL